MSAVKTAVRQRLAAFQGTFETIQTFTIINNAPDDCINSHDKL